MALESCNMENAMNFVIEHAETDFAEKKLVKITKKLKKKLV